MYCQVSISSSLCHHLVMGLTPPAPQILPRVGSCSVHTVRKNTFVSRLSSFPFIKSVLLVSFSFFPLLFLPFELHSFPPIIQLSLPSFFTIVFYVSIPYPSSVFVSSLLSPEAVPLPPASVISERWGKTCMSARGKNKDDPKIRVFHAEHLAVNTSFWHQADLIQHMGYGSLEDLNLPGKYPLRSLMEGAGTVVPWENSAGEYRLTSNVS